MVSVRERELPATFTDGVLNNLLLLKSYALTLTRNEGAAEDLVQSTVLRALSKACLYEEGTNLRAWLFTIMHNLHCDHIKLSRRETIFDLNGLFQDEEVPRQLLTNNANPPAAPGVILLRETCEAAMRLPLHLQVAVRALMEGDSYEQMAAEWNVPVGTVKSRCNRARTLLKEMTNRG